MSQSLDLVVDAARRLADRDDVVFVINGGGSALVGAEASRRGPRQPAVRRRCSPGSGWPRCWPAADIHVIPLRSRSGPLERPLQAVLDPRRGVGPCWPASIPAPRSPPTLEQAGAGCLGGAGGFRCLLRRARRAARRNRSTGLEMGDSGRRFVEGWVSPAAVAASPTSSCSRTSVPASPAAGLVSSGHVGFAPPAVVNLGGHTRPAAGSRRRLSPVGPRHYRGTPYGQGLVVEEDQARPAGGRQPCARSAARAWLSRR